MRFIEKDIEKWTSNTNNMQKLKTYRSKVFTSCPLTQSVKDTSDSYETTKLTLFDLPHIIVFSNCKYLIESLSVDR